MPFRLRLANKTLLAAVLARSPFMATGCGALACVALATVSCSSGRAHSEGSTRGAATGGAGDAARGGQPATPADGGASQSNPSGGGGAGGGATGGVSGGGVADDGRSGSAAGGASGSAGERGGSSGSNRGGTAGSGSDPCSGLPAGCGGAPGGDSGGSSGAAGASGTPAGAAGNGPASGPPLAFPGAQGFGKHATGGRDGSVYHVTNLNDSGPGSFRDAVSASNRIVVFDVGGTIALASAVSAKSDLTIAGQTAPGGGVALRGGELSFANSSNVICRYLRVRPGSETESTDDDALSLYRAKNVMIDHSSFEFGPWNDIDGVSDDWQNHPVTDITLQDSLIADPTGQQFGAHTESVSSQWAWYRNIFANSHNRNPLAKVNTVFVNNVLYNDSAGYTTHTSTSFSHDIVNNYFVFGPASTGTDDTWYQIDENQSIYAAGNLKDTNRNGALDGAETTPYWYQGEGTVLARPWSDETLRLPPLEPASAFRVALSLAGALPRDEVDALVVSQVATLGKGTTGFGAGSVGPDAALYTSQAQTGLANGGYGSLSGGTPPPDADHDGMPDAWELATGSDPARDDAMLKAPDGYALIEHYANWLAVPHAATSAGGAVAVDLTRYTEGFAAVAPSYIVASPEHGTVTLDSGGHTARFVPDVGFSGLGAFAFEVSGADGSAYASAVVVLCAP